MRLATLALLTCAACTGLVGADDGAGTDAGGLDGSVSPVDSGTGDSGVPDAGAFDDAGADRCGAALLCERFEEYDAGPLTNGEVLGPWKVNVGTAGLTTASLDSMPGGSRALHVHIAADAGTGSQLKTNKAALFAATHAQLYGRFLMYLGPDGAGVHWTIFGASGIVPAGTTTAGARATYLYSSFINASGKNQFSDVYGNSQTGQDCYHGSQQPMPVDRIACISFAMDATARTYRLALDGVPVPSMDLNDKGDGCVKQANQSWWGPDFDQLYVGALSFHPNNGPLDLWIDELIVDTSPVSCP